MDQNQQSFNETKQDKGDRSVTSQVLEYYQCFSQNRELPKYFCGTSQITIEDWKRIPSVSPPSLTINNQSSIDFQTKASYDKELPKIHIENVCVPSPTSSVASNRKLEWDNGADIGYSNLNLQKSISLPVLTDVEYEKLCNKLTNTGMNQNKASKITDDMKCLESPLEINNLKLTDLSSTSRSSKSSCKSYIISTPPSSPQDEFISDVESDKVKRFKVLKSKVGLPIAESTRDMQYSITPQSVQSDNLPNLNDNESNISLTFIDRISQYKNMKLLKLSICKPIAVECPGWSKPPHGRSKEVQTSLSLMSVSVGIQTDFDFTNCAIRKPSIQGTEKQNVFYFCYSNSERENSASSTIHTQTNSSNFSNCDSFQYFGNDHNLRVTEKVVQTGTKTKPNKLLKHLDEFSSTTAESEKENVPQFGKQSDSESLTNILMKSGKQKGNLKDLQRTINILQKLMKSKKYDTLTKKYYLKTIINQYVNSKTESSEESILPQSEPSEHISSEQNRSSSNETSKPISDRKKDTLEKLTIHTFTNEILATPVITNCLPLQIKKQSKLKRSPFLTLTDTNSDLYDTVAASSCTNTKDSQKAKDLNEIEETSNELDNLLRTIQKPLSNNLSSKKILDQSWREGKTKSEKLLETRTGDFVDINLTSTESGNGIYDEASKKVQLHDEVKNTTDDLYKIVQEPHVEDMNVSNKKTTVYILSTKKESSKECKCVCKHSRSVSNKHSSINNILVQAGSDKIYLGDANLISTEEFMSNAANEKSTTLLRRYIFEIPIEGEHLVTSKTDSSGENQSNRNKTTQSDTDDVSKNKRNMETQISRVNHGAQTANLGKNDANTQVDQGKSHKLRKTKKTKTRIEDYDSYSDDDTGTSKIGKSSSLIRGLSSQALQKNKKIGSPSDIQNIALKEGDRGKLHYQNIIFKEGDRGNLRNQNIASKEGDRGNLRNVETQSKQPTKDIGTGPGLRDSKKFLGYPDGFRNFGNRRDKETQVEVNTNMRDFSGENLLPHRGRSHVRSKLIETLEEETNTSYNDSDTKKDKKNKNMPANKGELSGVGKKQAVTLAPYLLVPGISAFKSHVQPKTKKKLGLKTIMQKNVSDYQTISPNGTPFSSQDDFLNEIQTYNMTQLTSSNLQTSSDDYVNINATRSTQTDDNMDIFPKKQTSRSHVVHKTDKTVETDDGVVISKEEHDTTEVDGNIAINKDSQESQTDEFKNDINNDEDEMDVLLNRHGRAHAVHKSERVETTEEVESDSDLNRELHRSRLTKITIKEVDIISKGSSDDFITGQNQTFNDTLYNDLTKRRLTPPGLVLGDVIYQDDISDIAKSSELILVNTEPQSPRTRAGGANYVSPVPVRTKGTTYAPPFERRPLKAEIVYADEIPSSSVPLSSEQTTSEMTKTDCSGHICCDCKKKSVIICCDCNKQNMCTSETSQTTTPICVLASAPTSTPTICVCCKENQIECLPCKCIQTEGINFDKHVLCHPCNDYHRHFTYAVKPYLYQGYNCQCQSKSQEAKPPKEFIKEIKKTLEQLTNLESETELCQCDDSCVEDPSKNNSCEHCKLRLRPRYRRRKGGLAYSVTLEPDREVQFNEPNCPVEPLENIKIKIPMPGSSNKTQHVHCPHCNYKPNICKKVDNQKHGKCCVCHSDKTNSSDKTTSTNSGPQQNPMFKDQTLQTYVATCIHNTEPSEITGKPQISKESTAFGQYDEYTNGNFHLLERETSHSLKDYLCKNKPQFVLMAEERRRCVLELAASREERSQQYKQFLGYRRKYPSGQVQCPLKKINYQAPFSTQEMKAITARNYKKCKEVQQRLEDVRERQIKRANKLMYDIFNEHRN